MGCSNSKLDNEELVLFCKERRRFIKQAVDHRYDLASAHVAYIHALKNVGIALRHVVEGDEMLMDSSNATSPGTTPIFTPPAPTTPESGASMPKKSPPPTTESPAAPDSSSTPVVNCLRSGTAPSVFFEERPPSPESVRIESYSPVNQFGIGGFFSSHMQPIPASPPMALSYNNPDFLSPLHSLPQGSTWDFFNPFSSLDSPYPYHGQRRLSQVFDEDDIRMMNQVREDEGIPDLEEEEHQENKKEEEKREIQTEEKPSNTVNVASEEQTVDCKPAVESTSDPFTQAPTNPSVGTVAEARAASVAEEIPSKSAEEAGDAVAEKRVEEAKEKPAGEEIKDKEIILEKANISPVVMLQAIKNIEDQFIRAYEAGKDVSALLEASKVHRSSGLGDIKEHSVKVLNSIALFRSSSSRSSSFRTNPASSSSTDNLDDSSSDLAEDCSMISGSHASTLDRIYAWEKKLYDEVKAGERLRITYDKKCILLRHQDTKGEDYQLVDKTRAAIKSLHTGIKVSIQAIDSVSKRIQKLRDEELQPQLLELIQGWMQMWKVMLDCHQIQYGIISEAKFLSSSISGIFTVSNRQATINLEHELLGWQTSFSNWINSQKTYVEALNGWLSKCIIPEPGASSKGRIPFSPRRVGAPLVFSVCRDWCRAFDQMSDKAVVAAIRNFAQEVRVLWEQQDEEQRQKRKAEYVARDLDKRVVTLQRVESRRQERDGMGLTDTGLAERKMSIDSFRKRAEEEKARHQKVLKETQNATLDILQTGLTITFEALTQFGTVAVNTYKELHENSQNGKISHA